MTLIRARADGRHMPLSHPVIQQRLALAACDVDQRAGLTEQIEALARLVVATLDLPPTPYQARLLKAIAAELNRRAEQTHEKELTPHGTPTPHRTRPEAKA